MGILKRIKNKLARKYYIGINSEKSRNLQKIVDSLESYAPVNFCSVGARDGNPILITYLRRLKLARSIGFEPDITEANILRNGEIYEDVFEYALGDCNTEMILNITKEPGCSSILKPNYNLTRKYFHAPEWFDIVKEENIKTTTLDSVKEKIPKIDIIQIDTQGYEYQIFVGGKETFKEIPIIIFEGHMYELYEGQKTFSEIHKLLTEYGFLLNNIEPQSDFGKLSVEFNFVYFNECLFKKDETRVNNLLNLARSLNLKTFDEYIKKII